MIRGYFAAYGTDWAEEHPSPLAALLSGTVGLDRAVARHYLRELDREPPTRAEAERLLGVALPGGEFEGLLAGFRAALAARA